MSGFKDVLSVIKGALMRPINHFCNNHSNSIMKTLTLLFVALSLLVAQSHGQKEIFDELGIPGKIALATIKNLCGTQPPVACTCDDDQSDDENGDEFDNVEIVTGPLPRCVPKTCICPDGSEQDLPSLPDRIKVKINKVLAKITAKIASKVTRVCQNDTEPTTCECRNALMGELDLPAQDVIDIARCRPSRCSCPGQAADGGDEWVVISPAKIIMDQLLKNVCSKETSEPLDTTAPTRCTCQDDTQVLPPFSVPQMKICQPKSCTCDGQEVTLDLSKLRTKAKYFKQRFNKLNAICPGDSAPKFCSCTSGDVTINPPFDNPLDILDCLPKSCTCEDDSVVNINADESTPFDKFIQLCGANAFPDTCTCEDDSSIIPREILNEATSSSRNFRKARKQLKRAFKNCRPKSCTCPNGDIETVTFMGCSEGGFPKCDSSRGKPQCTDGRKIKPLKAILAQINRKCVCDDGLAPKCKNGGQMLCPNGQTPDWSLAQLPQLFSQCSFDSREN